MDSLLPVLHKGTLLVVQGNTREPMSMLAAELALRGPVTIFDGGNRFAPYRIAALLRKRTTDIYTASARLSVRRAFTCYQMLALLGDARPLPQPYLLLDLLSTFYDEQIPPHEADRLLSLCLQHIARLQEHAPIVISLSPPALSERTFLTEKICEQADHVIMLAEENTTAQLALF